MAVCNAAGPDDVPPTLSDIVVTGTAGGSAVRRQDASFTVATVTAEQIEMAAPKSTAELLTQLPGVWVESSGGVSGANVNVTGFPEAGDAPHVTLEINGAPLYPTESLSFLEQTTMFRVDETIVAAEGQIGGPGAVFGKGEPGLTVNYRLREGGEETQGVVKYTTSDYSMQRFDVELSGKVSDGLYYMFGGYVSASPGIRNAQFLAEKGQQFTLNVTKVLPRGRIGVWTRVTDDVGQWLLPMFSRSGNNLGTFSPLGDATRFRQIQVGATAGGAPLYQNFDFANGRGWRGSISGLSAELATSDESVLRDTASYTSGDADTFGFVPDGGAIQVSALGLAPGVVQTLTTHQVLGATDWVQEYGYWVVKKEIRSFTNDLSWNVKSGTRNDLTVGLYSAHWSATDWWSLNNQAPVQNVAHGDLLNGAATCARLAAAGSGAGCWNYGISAAGDSTATALYVAEAYRVNDWLRLDAGVRRERQTVDYTLDSNDDAYSYPDGTINLVVPHATAAQISYTGAADFRFSAESAAFARYTHGVTFPNFDSFRNGSGAAEIQSINEAELGYKYTSPLLKLYATGFWSATDAFAGGVGTVAVSGAFRSHAYGAMLDGDVRMEGFELRVNATLQHAVYIASADPNSVGKKVQRQPDVRLLLSPAYTWGSGDWTTRLYSAVAYIGRRPADQDDSFFFDSYVTVDAGLVVTTPWRWAVRLAGQNLTDRHDATEGDPRSTVAANFRPILGRSAAMSVSYQF